MLETLGNHPQGKGLYPGDGLVTVGAVAEHAGQGRHFGQPAAVVFSLELDRESHVFTLYSAWLPNKRLQSTAREADLAPVLAV